VLVPLARGGVEIAPRAEEGGRTGSWGWDVSGGL
jgi:hypothetical protein